MNDEITGLHKIIQEGALREAHQLAKVRRLETMLVTAEAHLRNTIATNEHQANRIVALEKENTELRCDNALNEAEAEIKKLKQDKKALCANIVSAAVKGNTAERWASFCDSYAAQWMKNGQRLQAMAARVLADDIRALGKGE